MLFILTLAKEDYDKYVAASKLPGPKPTWVDYQDQTSEGFMWTPFLQDSINYLESEGFVIEQIVTPTKLLARRKSQIVSVGPSVLKN